jgi:hypothetical protein
VADERIFTLH